MKFEHRMQVDAPSAQVRAFLDDVARAARCVPGLEEIKELPDGDFEGKVRVRIGPLGMSFTGKAKLDKESADGVWRLRGEGHDRRIGAGVIADVESTLADLSPTSTEVVIAADVRFSGRLAELGQPLIKRKADSFVHEFAENLRKAMSAS